MREPRKGAKIEDIIESSYNLPGALFSPEGRQRYELGVGAAEKWQFALGKAVEAYATQQKLDSKRKSDLKHAASAHFWNAIEQRVPDLFLIVREPARLRRPENDRMHSIDDPYAPTTWHAALKAAAFAAYRHACPSDTARQALAYAKGLERIWPKKPKPDSATPNPA